MKKKITVIGIVLLLIAYLIFNIISYAGNEILYVGLNVTHSNGVGYGIGNPSGGNSGTEIWNLRNYNSANKNDESEEQKELYCLKGDYGSTWHDPDAIVTYNLSYDLQNDRTKLLGLLNANSTVPNSVIAEILDADNGYYGQLMWILDNIFIPGQSDLTKLLERIGIIYDENDSAYYYEPTEEYDYSEDFLISGDKYTLIETDVKAVQQAVIWYFMNAKLDNDSTFDIAELYTWLTITINNGQSYTNLEDYEKTTEEGLARYKQAMILCRYLIDSANNNADKYTQTNGVYSISQPISADVSGLTIADNGRYQVEMTRNGSNYIAGPIKIDKNNDLDYDITLKITDANGQEISGSNYIFTDSTGTSLGTNIKDLVGRTDGFYISIPKSVAKQINIDFSITYNTTKKTIWLSGTDNQTSITLIEEQPVAEIELESHSEIVQLTAEAEEFDLALRKYITAVNGTDVVDTRVPNISETTLETGTTATYNHRKDPVLVENADIVTYKITIYNEGEKAGYATEIKDQLPTGLKYAGASTITSNKNTYNVTYNESTNMVTFTATTSTALNKYQTGSLDNETLEFTCEVVAEPDTANDKILTNVAWISGAYDSKAGVAITNVGDDRDSTPQTTPTVNKDNMENYKGNSSNKTDLTDSEYHYQGEQDDDDFEKLVIEPQTSITVTKTWSDNNDQDGIRPDSVEVILYAEVNSNKEEKETVTLNETNKWTYTFENLPLKQAGNTITYTVAESSSSTGYSSTTTGDAVQGFTITNEHIPYITTRTVEKIWNDNDNQDGIRPTEIEVVLTKNGEDTEITAILDEDNGWMYTFTDLPIYENGNVIQYSVREKSEIPGYTVEVQNNLMPVESEDVITAQITVINTHIPSTVNVPVKKIWEDNNNQDGTRPTEITISLFADGTAVDGKTVTLNESNNWESEFTDLPEYSAGEKIEYTVKEEGLSEGYTVGITGDATNGYIITNTKKIFDLALRKNITKVNGTNVTNTRVPNISETTLENGTTATYNHRKDPVKVEHGNKVTYQITIYNEGEKTGYASQIIDQLPTGLIYSDGDTITSNKNTYNVTYDETNNKITFDITGTPTDLVAYETGNLDSEILEFECEVVAEPDTTNSKVLTNVAWISGAYDTEENKVAIDRDSQPETSPNVDKDNMQDYKGNSSNKDDLTDDEYYYQGEQDDDDFDKIVIEPESVEVSVMKVWDDNNNQDGKRPQSITITLYANNEEVEGQSITLQGEGNEWSYTFENLPKYENGQEIQYTVVETGIPQGYTSNTEGNMTDGFKITNSYTIETRNIAVQKVWVDNENQDGLRPTEITVNLLADGEVVEGYQSITLTGDAWSHTFDNLPKYKNGQEIQYTVEENGVPEGYTTLTTGNMTSGFTITNTYTPGMTSVKVTKVWEDNNNQDGLRTDSVSVSLLANGESVQTIELNEANEWTYIFTNLAEKANGEYITYTVAEITQIEGYTTTITNNNLTSEAGEIQLVSTPEFTITNTHETDEISIIVNKVWDDENNYDQIRPESVVVNIKNGETIVATETLNEENNWTYTFENLPAKENGENINYTIEEVKPEGYTVDIKDNGNNSYTITNTHIPEKAFDLALRKYITKINNNELTALGLGTRVPNISEATLQTGTTATYKHRKDPIEVEEGDIVTYQITIYNEGEKSGYASQIIDQLPTGLIYNPSSTVISKDENGQDKNTYTVTYEASTNKVIFDIVNSAENPAQDLDAYTTDNLDYETIEIKCKVVYTAVAGEKNILTNVAWINEAYDTVDNKEITEIGDDRDSEPGTKPNVNKDNMEDYKGNGSNKDNLSDQTYYYKGEQDDDDFEKLYVKTFDLSLRKFINSVNGNKTSREPVVDVTPLKNGTGTTAIYNHSKIPVALKVGDTVIYTIRVYNEGEIAGYANEVKDYLPLYLEYVENSTINSKYGWTVSEDGRIATTTYLSNKEISEFNGTELDYEDIQIECKISNNAIPDERITNIAEISEYKYGENVVPEDIDSESDNIDENLPSDEELPDYKKEQENDEYIPGNEDDDDFEKVYVKEFDLALRKFITQVQDREVTTRVPEVKIENETISYNHTKDPITLHVGDVVIYTLRIYNEGEISGYASEITDDIPGYLEYLPTDNTNVEYMWEMYDENGNITENVENAVKVKTTYLSKENGEDNLIQAFDGTTLSYKDIKIAFKVKDPNSNTQIITNYAQISDDTDEDGNQIKDKDSETDKWNEGEDDQDIENVKVEYFDLSILKFVSKVIVVEDGTEKITQTGYNGHENPEPVVKVELHKKKLDKVAVKFGYGITITNEGDVPGYATEITDYVPEGLRFEASDNPLWTDEGNNVISTKQLENTLLQPGESKTIEVILTWINGSENLALKTNIVEISDDRNEFDVPDRDSTPDNKVNGEDDIDLAEVILVISTGNAKTYFTLTLGLLGVVVVGIALIKKFVI